MAEDTCITSRESRLKWALVSGKARGAVRRTVSDVIKKAFLTIRILHPSLRSLGYVRMLHVHTRGWDAKGKGKNSIVQLSHYGFVYKITVSRP